MDESHRQEDAREEGPVTSDEERDIVLRQNDALPPDYRRSLRRCPICLNTGGCPSPSICRLELAEWAKRKWTAELEKEYARRYPNESPISFDDGPIPC